MSFEKYTVDQLRQEEQKEIRDGESRLASELARVFDEESIARGVEVDFDSDAQAFGRAITLLGLNQALQGEKPQLFVNGVSAQGAISTAFVRGADWVRDSGDIAGCLDLLQAEQWHTSLNEDKELQYGTTVISRIAMSGSAEELSQAQRTITYVSAMYQYEPRMFDEWGNPASDLGTLVDELRAESGGRVARVLDEWLHADGSTIELPRPLYSIAMGPATMHGMSSLQLAYNYRDGVMN